MIEGLKYSIEQSNNLLQYILGDNNNIHSEARRAASIVLNGLNKRLQEKIDEELEEMARENGE